MVRKIQASHSPSGKTSIKPILKKFFIEIHHRIYQKIKGWNGSLDEKWMHDLRVDLKRMQFVAKLLRQLGSVEKKIFRHYQQLFKMAGKIRAHHISVYRIRKHAEEVEALKAEKRYEHEVRPLHKKFTKRVHRFLEKEAHKKEKIVSSISALQSISFHEYLNNLREKIKAKFTDQLPSKKLHAQRKVLKSIVYSTELSPLLKKEIQRIFDLKKVVLLEDAIGDWHDLDYLLRQSEKGSMKLKKSSYKKLKQEKQKEREKIYSLIPKLVNR